MKKITLNSSCFFNITSLFLVIINNFPFLEFILNKNGIIFTISMSISLFLIFRILLEFFFNSKFKARIFFLFFININCIVLFFANKYKVSIHPVIIETTFATDMKEVQNIFDFKTLFIYLLFFAFLPNILFFKSEVTFQNSNKNIISIILHKIRRTIIYLFILLLTILPFYSKYKFLLSSTAGIIYSITPLNYIYSIGMITKEIIKKEKKMQSFPKPNLLNFWKETKNKTVFVFVIGESARLKNFSLAGYERETNPFLRKRGDLFFFEDTTSCGTATIISVPCMLSHLKEEEFIKKEKDYDSMFTFLEKLNFDTLWIDNNSHNTYKLINKTKENFIFIDQSICGNKFRCQDEEMIRFMNEKIENSKSNKIFIILHQYGSHGPDYFNRYLPEFEKFKPTCKNVDIEKCKKNELINTYDNSIIYTDYFLNKVINVLNEKKINSFLLYSSDHGESLGENGKFMHGSIEEEDLVFQKKVPMLIWFSNQFKKEFKINTDCFKKKLKYKTSHDNIFHTFYRILKIEKNELYQEELDLFRNCIKD